MKISWGIIVMLGFSLFAAGIIAMVSVSMTKNIDLVSDNYYEQGIKYQNQIDMKLNSAEFSDKIKTEIKDSGLLIEYSEDLIKGNFSGEIKFYRSSDAKKDFKVNIETDEKGIQLIPVMNLDKGLWKVQFSFKKDNKNYFLEKSIFIN
ncbi:MAG: FixH family protein [Ignavibacteria bacterium]|nr:FixH family protein [Ignavibacteria bacterium]MBK7157423.1 FixH family protein [Ignavibacteria bacterium]